MYTLGGSPGVVVTNDDSCSKGCGFEYRRRILDGHFFTLICCKNCIVCLKRPKINEKDAGVGPFKKQCTHLGSCLPIASKLERLECCSDPETATRRWVGHCSNRNWLLATNNSPEKEERNCDGIRTQALGNLRPFTTDE